ncbi:MAG: hypothetical protein K0Q94_6535, partial [Paenibacillus sp.]|nr:hypothetical protein [Paenibacillus sp.]
MGNRIRILRKTIGLTLALAIPLSGLLSQAGIVSAAPSAGGTASETMLRSLLSELTPEALASIPAESETNADPLVKRQLGVLANDAQGVVKSVYAGEKPAAPILDPMPAYSNAMSIAITGSAAAGATVLIGYSLNNGGETEAGSASADASGRFRFDLPLTAEGVYRVTAVARLNDISSDRSASSVVTADRTPPERVENANWKQLYPSNTTVLLQWTPPLAPDGQGGSVPDPSVTRYKIYDKENGPLQETAEKEAIFGNLEPASLYQYRVRAVDAAGNESDYEAVFAGTSPSGEVKLADLSSEIPPALSGDGSTALYADEEYRLYSVDTMSGEKRRLSLTMDGEAPNGEISDLTVNRTGSVFAFSSDATNLRAAKPSGGSELSVYVYDADTELLELVSLPANRAGKPTLNGDGRLLAFAESNQIYLYDRVGKVKSLVSKTEDGSTGNGMSASPDISGDGTRIAYETTSTNLKGAPAAGGGSANAIAV